MRNDILISIIQNAVFEIVVNELCILTIFGPFQLVRQIVCSNKLAKTDNLFEIL